MSGAAEEFLQALRKSRVIAIVRGDFTVEQYGTIAESLVAAGIPAVELTIEKPNALEAIERLAADGPSGLWLGAGTVRSAGDARAAVEAGASYLISPGFVTHVASVARGAGVPYLPGVLTPSEVEIAVAAGCSAVKLFPARPLGPSYLEALRAPLAGVDFVPTGGIGIEDAHEFLAAGALAVGLGSSLTGKRADPEEIAERARSLLENIESRVGNA